jgi:small conductance mechanosensitive channel
MQTLSLLLQENLTGIFNFNPKQILIDYAPRIIGGFVILLCFFIAAKIGQRIINRTIPRVKADPGIVLLLSRVYYYSVIIFGLITALPKFGLNVDALITGLGLTGFALGFALKDVLANLLSGIMLLMYRPFNINDQIVMGAFEGTIEDIRMRDTLLRSYDGRLVIIPNTKLITEVVINNSSSRLIREALAINILDENHIEIAREIVLKALDSHPQLKNRVEPSVTTNRTSSTGIVQLEAYFWYDPRQVDKIAIKNELTQTIKKNLDDAGIKSIVTQVTSSQNQQPNEPPILAKPAEESAIQLNEEKEE